ncbi:protein FAM171B-like [Hippocampus comes]|uniref:protein FAM171B-like n=1 Tax=Hippocampus comes TaxID=109280 RepID=UPI00094E7B0E|nr:PREDICTED: protein FAM171B-like [Hippocampus comes]
MLVSFLLSAVILCESEASGEFAPTGAGARVPTSRLHVDEEEDGGGNFSARRIVEPSAGSKFNLKVQVADRLTRQFLSQAEVALYVNYARTKTVFTGEDGGVLLRVPFQSGSPVTITACRDGYVCAALPYGAIKAPIFSSVTAPLVRLTQGNIWLFEDSLLIADKTSDASVESVVRFPRSLLNMTEGGDVASLKAYLTILKPASEERGFPKTVGVTRSAAGYAGVELNPAAAVSVRLFSGDAELNIRGPIKISLTLPDNCGLQSSNALPAWLYNRTTGGWMRRGLGTVVSESGKLSWTFTAPHLGDWIAAPVPTAGDVFGPAVLRDFFVQYSSLLLVVLGGTLCVVACLLAGFVYCHRRTKATRTLPLTRKDQSTTTGSNEDVEGSSPSQRFLTQRRLDQHNVTASILNGNGVLANPKALAAGAESDHMIPPSSVPASPIVALLYYDQPVAIPHPSAFVQADDQTQRWSPALYAGGAEKLREEGSGLKVSRGSSATRTREGDTGGHADSTGNAPVLATRGQRGLLESASVPETLSKMGSGRHSMDAATELSKAPSSQPPRAWFVSLEGKPAAEIRYAVAEHRQRRRAAESRETSLDSGVDMIEMNQVGGRRAVALERSATFVKSASGSKPTSR